MDFFQYVGRHAVRFMNSISLFFSFLGHVCHSAQNIFTRHQSISWNNVLKVLYYSGTTIVLPLFIISILIGMALSISSINILKIFNLQSRALPIAQAYLIRDIIPMIIGFVLCIQSSLNIINARIRIKEQKQTTQDVVLEYIIPIILGINFSGLLLHIYLAIAAFISLFLVFHHFLLILLPSFFFEIFRTTTLIDIFFSILKTLLYCTIISLTASYYYYQIATHHLSLRKAISRILTRGFLWLTLSSVYLKLIYF